MKWILLFFAFWNVSGALLRIFRMRLERLPIGRRFYPSRNMLSLDEVSDLELSSTLKARYRAAVENLSRATGMRAPDLYCSLRSTLFAGTRGWSRHQVHVSRGILSHASDKELLAIIAHELGHIYYRHFAVLRIVELVASLAYARVVYALWETHLAWYVYLGLWSLLDFAFSLTRLAAGSATELMADHFAAHKLNLAEELSRGLLRAQCFNGATDFAQITHFYPTVKLRLRLLSRYAYRGASVQRAA
jgi:Zn-dependent protease with chaperone function